jgi:hypothetical protein
MARTTLPIVNAVANSGVTPVATAIDAVNGMVISLPTGDIPSDASTDRLVLIVNNTFTSAKNVYLRKGASNPPAFRKDIGDASYSIASATTAYFGPFDLSRFTQGGSPATLNVDFDTGITGTVIALLLPRTV